MTEYANIFTAHMVKLRDLWNQQTRIQGEIKSVQEMMKASFNMMPDSERTQFSSVMTQAFDDIVKQELGLTDAIKNVLESNRNQWLSAVSVRNKLTESGFDFSSYTSNPLASVHTVLKRFKRKEVKTRELLPGNREYRWIKPRQVSLKDMLTGKLEKLEIPEVPKLGELRKK